MLINLFLPLGNGKGKQRVKEQMINTANMDMSGKILFLVWCFIFTAWQLSS